MAASSSLTCSIRGCVNELRITNPSHLLYVCTLDDVQCKSWLAVIPKTSLKPLHDKLCVCSLHFAGGSGAAANSVPTIFPPVPGGSEETITGEPHIGGPAIKIKEEPIDDYELSASGMESSECTRSPAAVKEEDDESSMEVTEGTSAGPSRIRGLIPASAIKKEIDDLNNGATSSSAADEDSSSLGGGGFLRLESCSYPVKQEPLENGEEDEEDEDDEEEGEEEEDEDEDSEDVDDVDESTIDGMVDDDAEIATPAPGSGCGVDPGPCVASSNSSAYLPPAVVKVEEFGECPAEDYEIENLGPSGVTIKTEPPDEVAENGMGEPSSADQGCQANDGSATSVALMPPGFISEEPSSSSSVAVGSSMLTVGNGILAGDTGFVISNAFSCVTGAGVVEDPHQAAVRKHQATSTNRTTRTVWTQTYEPEKRTVWTQVAQLGDLKMLYHRATQTDPWLERSPRIPKVTRRKRTYDEIAGKKH